MNAIGSVFIYFMIGGCIFGLSQNSRYERCGAVEEIKWEELTISAVLWPALIGVAAVINDEALKKISCKQEIEK